jgi:Ni,Fe-hydrogenase I cytochrome b subunit
VNWKQIITYILLIMVAGGCGISSLWDKEPPVVEQTSNQLLNTVVYKTNWINSLCILSIGLGAIAFFNGHKLGLGVIIGSCVSLWANITLIRYAHFMAVAGLIAGILCVGYAIYLKRKALRELVSGVERYKKCAAPVWQQTVKNHMGAEQSPTTEKIVTQIRKKLNGKNGEQM